MTMRLEPACPDDLDQLHALIDRAYRGDSARTGWTHEADLLEGQRTDTFLLSEILADPVQHLLIGRERDRITACVSLHEKGAGRVYIGMVTVDPDLQGGGRGRRLLAAAESFAASELGANRIEMTVIAQRRELIAWYQRRGYRLTGERRAFPYGDTRFGLPKRDDLEFAVLEKAL